MTVIYLQHGGPGEPMSTESVKWKTTAAPVHKRGNPDAPTVYMVRVNDRWARVHRRQNGTHYITRNYRRIAVTIGA